MSESVPSCHHLVGVRCPAGRCVTAGGQLAAGRQSGPWWPTWSAHQREKRPRSGPSARHIPGQSSVVCSQRSPTRPDESPRAAEVGGRRAKQPLTQWRLCDFSPPPRPRGAARTRARARPSQRRPTNCTCDAGRRANSAEARKQLRATSAPDWRVFARSTRRRGAPTSHLAGGLSSCSVLWRRDEPRGLWPRRIGPGPSARDAT